MHIINKIAAMSPPTNKKETQAFLGVVVFWRMHIPNYSLTVSPLYHITWKKNDFKWGPEQRQAFEQMKQEIVHAVALGPVRAGPDVKNVLYTAAGENGPTWSLWQKAPGETRVRPLGFWSWGYRRSEARYTPREKEILATYEGVRAASEVIGTEAQLLLAPRLPVLGWMFKERVPSTHHATDATWSKWVALITQRARIGNPNRPGILEVITDWPEGKDFGMSPEEEVTRAEEAPPYNKLPEDEKPYALFTDGSCRIMGKHQRWKAAVWSPTGRVAEAAEGEGESSQFAEVKAIQLALGIAEREKWPTLYLYTDSRMVANALWGWLQQWKQSNWQRRGKPIWAAPLWQDIAARLEKLAVKVRHVDAHVPKSRATEEHENNQQVDQAAKIEVAQVDLDWQPKGELFIAWWAHDTSGHQGRDATYRWARDQGVDLSMDAISQVIHECETCTAIKQAKQMMAFPVDMLNSYSHEDLESSAEDYLSDLRHGDPRCPEFLSLPDHGKVKSVGERVVLYVLNRIIYRKQEIETNEVPFLCHGSNDYAKIMWKKGEAVGFYSVKPTACKHYLEKYPGDHDLLWEVQGTGHWFQRTPITTVLQREKLKIAEVSQKENTSFQAEDYFRQSAAESEASGRKTELETQLNETPSEPLNGEVTEETGKTSLMAEEETANEVLGDESKLQSESQEEPLMLFVPLILESPAKPSEDTVSEVLNANDSEVLTEESTSVEEEGTEEHHQKSEKKSSTENAAASALKEQPSDDDLPNSMVIEAAEESGFENVLPKTASSVEDQSEEAGHNSQETPVALSQSSLIVIELKGVSFQQPPGQEVQKNQLEEHLEESTEQTDQYTQTVAERAADSSSEEAEIEVPIVDRRNLRRKAKGYKGPPKKKGKLA
ncbi:hypothetical protein GRJ2_003447800 [Grus japonensis]|uniref:RNase H type-1 domain-containing protein n=1 Tax=Grus japonensis TaxID=30415 RepID=A0ABC9YJS6_GRUJA